MRFDAIYNSFNDLNGSLDKKSDSMYILGEAQINELASGDDFRFFKVQMDNFVPDDWKEHGRIIKKYTIDSQILDKVYKERWIFY